MNVFLQRFDVRVSLGYCVIAVLWIVLSDNVVGALFSGNPSLLGAIGSAKGIGYVVITALALFAILHNEMQKRDRLEQALQDDVNERTKTMDALKKSERRFASIFHGSPVPIGISRLSDAKIVDGNAALLKLFGYEQDELIGKPVNELVIWSDEEKRAETIKLLTETGSVRSLEAQGRTKSGDTIYILGTAQLLDLGSETHVVSMLYDVTEQKKLEEQLHYQARLLTNASDAVISTDTEFNIRSWNPAAEEIYGWKAEEVLGKPVMEVVDSEFLDTTQEDALLQLQTKGIWRGETIHHHKDGKIIYLQASTTYVNDREGRLIGIVSINRDITERIQAQKELQAAEKLRLELDKEKELLQLKEQFISVVSHEFRTPLSVIMSSAELVQKFHERMPLERQLEHIHVVLLQAEFMVSLLDDVLTVNKARAGRLEFKPMQLDLIRFCQETLERVQVLDNANHEFVFSHDDNLTDVKLDAKLLQHILVNLLSNAMKYSPDGGEVKLEANREEESVIFRVIDQGIGIPEEGLVHLYDLFYRAHNTGDIGGTGLGLSIVKESVALHSGTIICESKEGVGTTFTVQLPIEA